MVELKRLISKTTSMFSSHGYAKSSFIYKITLLILLSALIVVGFGSIIGLDASYRSFSEPSGIPDFDDNLIVMSVAIIETIIGVILLSMIIAVISQAYSEQIKTIMEGKYDYKGRGHIVIIGYSNKLPYILKVINASLIKRKEVKDLILIIDAEQKNDEIEKMIDSFSFRNISLNVKYGNTTSYNFLAKSSIQSASKIMIMNDGEKDNSLAKDNKQVKIVSELLGDSRFRLELRKSLKSGRKTEVIVELSGATDTERVINGMCQSHDLPSFTTFNSWKFSKSIISSSIVDNEYLKLFYTLVEDNNSEIIVAKVAEEYPVIVGKSFERAVQSFKSSMLLAVLDDTSESNNYIFPKNKVIKGSDRLVILKYKDQEPSIDRKMFVESQEIKTVELIDLNNTLKEWHSRKVLIIGGDGIVNQVRQSLDRDSAENLKIINEKNPILLREYIYDELIEHEKYDTVLINLDENLTFSIFMDLAYSNTYANLDFMRKTIVVLKDNDHIVAVSKSNTSGSIFNEDYLTGMYMGQLCFNPELSNVYWELVTKEGGEFYLIDSNEEILEFLKDDILSAKRSFINSGMNLVGLICEEGKVIIGCSKIENFRSARKLIVTARGNL